MASRSGRSCWRHRGESCTLMAASPEGSGLQSHIPGPAETNAWSPRPPGSPRLERSPGRRLCLGAGCRGSPSPLPRGESRRVPVLQPRSLGCQEELVERPKSHRLPGKPGQLRRGAPAQGSTGGRGGPTPWPIWERFRHSHRSLPSRPSGTGLFLHHVSTGARSCPGAKPFVRPPRSISHHGDGSRWGGTCWGGLCPHPSCLGLAAKQEQQEKPLPHQPRYPWEEGARAGGKDGDRDGPVLCRQHLATA